MAQENSTLLKSLEGRLFVESGRLFYVLDVDPQAGTASVSVGDKTRRSVVEMPLNEIGAKVGACNKLTLDGLRSAETESRVGPGPGGWHFDSREGRYGPFADEEEAKARLRQHILMVQGVDIEYEGRVAKVISL